MISVIVPIYSQEEHIAACTESLLSQDIAPAEMEIIVVDNNSRDRGPEVASRYPVLLLHEEAQGDIFALRKGIESARGDIIARIDGDCVAYPNWVRRIQERFRDPDVKIVMGFTEGINRNLWAELQQRHWEDFWFRKGPQGLTLKRRGFDTRNFAIRRALLAQFVGHKDWARHCNDLVMSLMLNRMGVTVHFDQRIVARHHNMENLHAQIEKRRAYGADYYRVVARQPQGFEDPNLPVDIRFWGFIDNRRIRGRKLRSALAALKLGRFLLVAAMRSLSTIYPPQPLLFRLYKTAAGMSSEIGILEAKLQEEGKLGMPRSGKQNPLVGASNSTYRPGQRR